MTCETRATPRARSTSRSVTTTSSIALPRNSPATASIFRASAGVVRSARAAISAFTSPSTCALTDSCCISRRASSAASLLSCIPRPPVSRVPANRLRGLAFFFQLLAQFVPGLPVLRVLFGIQSGLDALLELHRIRVHFLFIFAHHWLLSKVNPTFVERLEGPRTFTPYRLSLLTKRAPSSPPNPPPCVPGKAYISRNPGALNPPSIELQEKRVSARGRRRARASRTALRCCYL